MAKDPKSNPQNRDTTPDSKESRDFAPDEKLNPVPVELPGAQKKRSIESKNRHLGPKPRARRPRTSEPRTHVTASDVRANFNDLEVEQSVDEIEIEPPPPEPKPILDTALAKKRAAEANAKIAREVALREERVKERAEKRSQRFKALFGRRSPEDADSPPPPPEPEPELFPHHNKSLMARFGLGLRDFVLVAVAFLPAVIAAYLVHTRAVDMPYGQDWDRLELISTLHEQGSEIYPALTKVEHGQRQFVPKFLHLFLTRLTGGNIRVEIWLNLAFLIAVGVGSFVLLARTVGGGAKLGLTMLVANLLLFSPLNWRELFSPHMSGIFIATACIVWAVFFATRSLPWWVRLGFCLIITIIGTYSFAHALMLWPVVLLVVLVAESRDALWQRLTFVGIWILFGGFIIGDYFADFTETGISFARFSSFMPENGEAAVTEWFAVISESVTRGWQQATEGPAIVIPGLTVICLFLLFAIFWMLSTIGRGRLILWNRCLPWIGLGVCALGGAAIANLVIEQPVAQPFARDFTLIAMPLLLGIVVIFVILTTDKVQRSPESSLSDHIPIFWAVAFLAIVVHQAGNWYFGYRQVVKNHDDRLKARSELLLMNFFKPENLEPFGTDNENVLRERVAFLNQHGYLTPAPFSTLHLSGFSPQEKPLDFSLNQMVAPKQSEVGYVIEGETRLPGRRIPNAIFVVQQSAASGKSEVIGVADESEETAAAWKVHISKKQLTASESPIQFWAFDAAKVQAHQLTHRFRILDGKPVLEKVVAQ